MSGHPILSKLNMLKVESKVYQQNTMSMNWIIPIKGNVNLSLSMSSACIPPTQCSEDVPQRVSLLGVPGHGSDGDHLDLPPLVSLQRHQQRHGVIHPRVSVYDQPLPGSMG